MASAAADTQIYIKALNKYLNVRSGNLRAADAKYLQQNLGCQKGLVNYFSIFNDS